MVRVAVLVVAILVGYDHYMNNGVVRAATLRATGEILHADEWWGERVDLDFYYIDPAEVIAGVTAAGFTVSARTDREPLVGVEHESRRCYLLCRRN